MVSDSRDQQVRHVVEGAALGVIAAGVEGLTSVKMALELNFGSVWRRWEPAVCFPSILRHHDPGNLFFLGVHASAGRRWGSGRWEVDGPWVRPFLRGGWELSEIGDCLDDFADEHTTAEDWRSFGRLYVEKFRQDEVLR